MTGQSKFQKQIPNKPSRKTRQDSNLVFVF